MPQIARPVADKSSGLWTPTPVFEEIDELLPNDLDFVTSGNVNGDTFEVYLASMAFPDTGPQTLSVRFRKTTADNAQVSVMLLEGTNVVAFRIIPGDQITPNFQTFNFALMQTEIDNITNYTDLRVRVKAGLQTTTGCSQCPQVPQTWAFTMAGNTCSGFNRTYNLAYESGCLWREFFGIGMASLNFVSGSWELTIGAGPINAHYSKAAASWNCLGCNLMNFQSSAGSCSGLPATLNVCPI